jgi:hypothetical protein
MEPMADRSDRETRVSVCSIPPSADFDRNASAMGVGDVSIPALWFATQLASGRSLGHLAPEDGPAAPSQKSPQR